MIEPNIEKRYSVKGYLGVAFRFAGYPRFLEPYIVIGEDEDGNEIEVTGDDGDYIEDTEGGKVLMVMVGDDREHLIDIDDLSELDDLDYCAECGQIGCTHDGRNREKD